MPLQSLANNWKHNSDRRCISGMVGAARVSRLSSYNLIQTDISHAVDNPILNVSQKRDATSKPVARNNGPAILAMGIRLRSSAQLTLDAFIFYMPQVKFSKNAPIARMAIEC